MGNVVAVPLEKSFKESLQIAGFISAGGLLFGNSSGKYRFHS
jgi:hypothetical protein